MMYGYMGKILFVNLSTGEISEETPGEKLYRESFRRIYQSPLWL